MTHTHSLFVSVDRYFSILSFVYYRLIKELGHTAYKNMHLATHIPQSLSFVVSLCFSHIFSLSFKHAIIIARPHVVTKSRYPASKIAFSSHAAACREAQTKENTMPLTVVGEKRVRALRSIFPRVNSNKEQNIWHSMTSTVRCKLTFSVRALHFVAVRFDGKYKKMHSRRLKISKTCVYV